MNISDDVNRLIKKSAPTLLTAINLPPPFNIIAATVVSGLFNSLLPANTHPQNANVVNAANPAPLTPQQIVSIIDNKQTSPDIISTLREAENCLKQYEITSGLQFADLALQDKQKTQDFQINSGLAATIFDSGMKIVWIAMGGLLLVIGATILLLTPWFKVPEDKANMITAVFGILGTVIGFINGIAANIVGYYWGSSQGSKEKSQEMASSFKSLGDSLAKTVEANATAVNNSRPAPVAEDTAQPVVKGDAGQDSEVATSPKPASKSLLNDTRSELVTPHLYVKSGVSWNLQKEGISIEGAAPVGTQGNPTTVEKIWTLYGPQCLQASAMYGVPVELIIATIATESGGDKNARRSEPRINDESVGLMQTLVKTARDALGRATLTGDDLLNPATSIEAGTAYIAHQRFVTHFDPPKVAAAYNAGSLRLDEREANRWKMLCYPTGTGRHIDNFVAWFNDCMKEDVQEKWRNNKDISTYTSLF
ncbi:transglycosylase SLT domain-containing protein [Enterobacteriaceae bacterium RIT691]|nr:transglycosylase SLT domain-containing protein [Enterobacteriaceae bacterium RIT691]